LKSPTHYNLVAVGGGTGLPLVLKAALALGYEPDAVVTMADDGGSSGRLRRELGIVPPGDVRNCLVALADPKEQLLADLLNYRFTEGEGITGHALGNLIMAALIDMSGSFEEAVGQLEDLLEVRGCVLPSTYDTVALQGFDRAGEEIFGQASLALSPVAIADVKLSPADPQANPEAVAALESADAIIICPGSLYTSIIPNLLVPDILAAIQNSPAQLIYCCNVANMRGETTAFTPLDYLEALEAHGLAGRINTLLVSTPPTVIAPTSTSVTTPPAVILSEVSEANVVEGPQSSKHLGPSTTLRSAQDDSRLNQDGNPSFRHSGLDPESTFSTGQVDPRAVYATPEIINTLHNHGINTFTGDLVSPENPVRHDLDALTRALKEVIGNVVYR
jgi:uncharacterized cofD-like protein